MSRQRTDTIRRDRLRKWLRGQQWLIIGSAVFLGILAVFLIGCATKREFVRDVAANLASDAVVAVVAFIVIDMVFGLRERRQRRVEARVKASTVLQVEMVENQLLLESILQASRGEVSMPESWPRLRSRTWTAFLQSPLVADLDNDLLWKLYLSYEIGERAVDRARDWRSHAMWKPWHDMPTDLVSEVERAEKLTSQTFFMLTGSEADED